MAITLQEYLSTSQRGILNKVFGPEYMMKQTYLESSGMNIFTETFGRRVWDAMNNRTVLYNAIKKVGWGPTFGWRLRTDRGEHNSYAVTETGDLPVIDVSDYRTIGSPPKFPATTFGVSIKAQFMGGLEGGIGDALAVEQEGKMRDHIKLINESLTRGCYAYVDDFDTTGGTTADPEFPEGATFAGYIGVAPDGVEKRFQIGDTVGVTDAGAGTHDEDTSGGDAVTVVAIDLENHRVCIDGDFDGFTPAAGDVLYVVNRATSITGIPSIVAEDGMLVCGGGNLDIQPGCYAIDARAAETYLSAALVNDNDGVARDLTLKALDDSIDAIRERGGMMGQGLIVTGHGQYSALDRLLQAQQRYLGYSTFQFGVGDERTYPGTQVGMELASYRGLPILPDADIPKSSTSAGVAIGHDIYILDLDHLEIGVAMPTQYFENQNYFVAGALVIQGLMFTALELRSRRLDVHAAIVNLNA